MTHVTLGSGDTVPTASVRMGGDLSIHVSFACSAQPLRPVLGLVVKHQLGFTLFGVNNRFIPGYRFTEPISEGVISCDLATLPLMPGLYLVDLYFGDEHRDRDVVHDAIAFEVLPADVYGSGKLPPAEAGPLFQHARWSLRVGASHVPVSAKS